jgi:nitrous oxide reductase
MKEGHAMPQNMNRREFISESLLAATAGALAGGAAAQAQSPSAPTAPPTKPAQSLPTGTIGG